MGISYKNGSGYADPTAYEAVANIEREEKMLHIGHSNGYIDIRMDAFFPCTVQRGQKVFRLVRKFCTQEDKKRLLLLLRKKEQKYTDQLRTFTEQIDRSEKASEKKQYLSRAKEANRMLLRTRRNLEQFMTVAGYKEV